MQKTPLSTLTKISGLLWFLSILAEALVLYVGTNGFAKEASETEFGRWEYFPILFILIFLAGIVFFAIGVVAFTIKLFQDERSRKRRLLFLIKLPIILTIFPLYLIFYVTSPIKFIKKLRKLGIRKAINIKTAIVRFFALGIIIFILFPAWILSYFTAGILIGQELRLLEVSVPVAGTGSMYPTFPKGQEKTLKEQGKEIVDTPGMIPYPNGLVVFGRKFFGHEIQRGDIVVFENEKVREVTRKIFGDPSGSVKRVIALPGDTIEIRDGLILLNSQPLSEPYIAKARSTFGGEFLPDCRSLTVPEGKLFVMGDNRKGSGDSRHKIGLIDFKDIDHVIPWEKQKGVLDKNWHDTSNDSTEQAKIKLNKEEYLSLLNEKRKEEGVKLLNYQTKLEKSAAKRGEIILKFNDFSFEATSSGYKMEKAMRDAGYSNIVWGEAPTQGHYEAEELIENQFEFPESKKFLLSKDFQEIGIAEVEGEINKCPTQVIIQHLAGYVPPNYKKEEIEGWRNVLAKLKEVQPGWQNLKNYPDFYEKNREDVNKVNEIISIRITNIEAVVKRMEANQWLTKQEIDYTQKDESLFKEQNTIATRLNSL